MSLSTRILLGLALGIAVGLFFGEYVAFLGVVGDGFVMLLQMTVLPYVTVSLALGLGSVSGAEASNLARRAGGFLLLLWALSLAAVFLSPLALPDWESASFFSTNLLEERQDFDFLGLFIPSNIFRSLADAVVPAIVLFSLAVGAALIGIPEDQKAGLLQILATLSEAFSRITNFVVRLAPYGVFAITAHAGGTLSLEEVEGLQVFAALYIALALVLTFWTLPVLVTTLTPFSYREVVWSPRDALVTSFATGNMFVVLAMLADRSKELLRSRGEAGHAHDALVDVVVPTSFTFPSAGKLLTLSFLFFAGWLSGYTISLSQYPSFLATGLAAFFGNTMVAVPFLLDLFRIPADMFPLFVIVDNIVGNRFGAVLAAMHTLVLVLLSASAMAGMLRVRLIPVARYLVITLLLTLAAVGGVRLLFETFSRPYQGYTQLIRMRPLFPTVKVAVLDAAPNPLPRDAHRDSPTLDRILERGTLRVGYASDSLPFVFTNEEGELVGFDVEMAHSLAGELGVSLELVRIEASDLPGLLDAGYLDTVMSGVQLTPERMAVMSFSSPYLEEALGFLVRDHRREEFSSRKSLQRMDSPRIGVLDVPYHVAMLRLYLPQAEIVVLQSPREFLAGEGEALDAMLFPAQSGAAWSLVYPRFSVAIPQPDVVSAPVAYPVARGDLQMAAFLSNWVELQRKDGTVEALHDHWILGDATKNRGPRWSVIRDVFGWVE